MSEVSYAAIARRVAAANPDVASYRDLAEQMLAEVEGHETELLAKLLPGYLRAVLSRRGRSGSDEEIWQAFLDERMPSRNRGTIFTRDATVDDLSDAVARRRKFAGNLDRRALQMEQVRERMAAEGVRRVADITDHEGILHDVEWRLADAHSRRMNAENRARALTSLQRAKALLQEWLTSGDTPTLQALRSQRSHLQELVQQQLLENRRALIRREVLEELRAAG